MDASLPVEDNARIRQSQAMCVLLPHLPHGSGASLGLELQSCGVSGILPLQTTVHGALAARFLSPSFLQSQFLCAAWDVSGRDLVFITSCYGWR